MQAIHNAGARFFDRASTFFTDYALQMGLREHYLVHCELAREGMNDVDEERNAVVQELSPIFNRDTAMVLAASVLVCLDLLAHLLGGAGTTSMCCSPTVFFTPLSGAEGGPGAPASADGDAGGAQGAAPRRWQGGDGGVQAPDGKARAKEGARRAPPPPVVLREWFCPHGMLLVHLRVVLRFAAGRLVCLPSGRCTVASEVSGGTGLHLCSSLRLLLTCFSCSPAVGSVGSSVLQPGALLTATGATHVSLLSHCTAAGPPPVGARRRQGGAGSALA